MRLSSLECRLIKRPGNPTREIRPALYLKSNYARQSAQISRIDAVRNCRAS
ncbi:Uncharacterised protein [Vibrio cholerae]|nr:Uncharacterised protein [Vibrio cholerae]